MAAPNLMSLTTVNVDTAHLDVTSSATDIISAVTANHARKCESILATNVHASTVGWISVWHRKSSTDHLIAYMVRVPLRSTVNVLLGSPLYLNEGDSLKVQANANSNIHAAVPYVDMV